MTLAELQAELETLAYGARMTRIIALGRDAQNAPLTKSLLDEMEQGGFDLRWMALNSCYGSRDGERALRMLTDSSRLIRRGAAAMLAQIGTGEQIVIAQERIQPKNWRNLLLGLHKRRRYDVIEAYLQNLETRRDEDWLRECLPFGSANAVRRLLPQVVERFSAYNWARLARFHPDIALEMLQAQAYSADRPDAGLTYRANAALPIISETRPQAALVLVQTLLRHIPLPQLQFQRLASFLPRETADMVLANEANPVLPLQRLLPRLDTERVVALFERYGAQNNLVSRIFARRFTPETRDRLYAQFGRGWQNGDGCIPPATVGALSRPLREQEARRHLNLPALAPRPAERLPYASFLPWDEAREILDPFLRNPEPDLRVLAHAQLANAVRYNRSHLADLLTLQLARKNEQDPVRLAMLNGLAGLPPGIWKPEHLDDLALILRNGLNAADLSGATVGAMKTLVVKLLKFYPHWCAEWMATLAKERGSLNIGSLENRLSDGDVKTLAPILLPVLRGWETREGWDTLLSFAGSLGRRLRVFDELAVMLEQIVQTSAAEYRSRTALHLLAKHRHERLATLVPNLIAADPSWATQPTVYTYLHRHRQDLITPFLGFKAYSGRFSTGKTRFVLPLRTGFERWTAMQQQLFARVLTEVTRDEGRDTPAIQSVITQLAALPAVFPARIVELAQLESKPLAARDAALRALAKLDSGEGVPVLLEAMGDDRGRIAIYALRRAMLEMPAERALELLRGLPMEKVTVAKEVIRLLGELKTEAAYQELLLLEARDLHRDARIALLRAFWDFLERDATWEKLDSAARSPEPAVAAHVSRIPATGLSQRAQIRLIGVLALLLQHPDARVRLDTLNRCATLPVTDREHKLLPLFLQSVASPINDEQKAASAAVFMTYTGRDATLVGQTVQTLLPNRRALKTLVTALNAQIGVNRARLLPTARAVLNALQTDPLTGNVQIDLVMQALPGEEIIAIVRQMAATRALHADALQTAKMWMTTLETHRRDIDLFQLETALVASDDRYVRRLALAALVAQANGATGWTDERLARLQTYRNDPAPLVAEAAQFTFPPGE